MVNLKEDLMLLNQIAKYEVESDWDSDSIIYIAVDFEKTKEMIKKFLEGNSHYSYDEYLADYLEDGTIDICGLWGEIDQTYKIDTWFNMKKKEFYITKWYHRVIFHLMRKKTLLKYRIINLISKIHYWKLEKEYNRKLKKRMKLLSKIYRVV